MVSDLANQVLPDIYACCEQEGRWQQALDRIRDGLGVRSAVVQIFRRDGMRLRELWNARDTRSLSQADLHDAAVNNESNPRLDLRLARPPVSQIMRDQDRFARNCPHLAQLEQRLATIGLRGGTGIGFELSETHYFSMILHRSIDDRSDFEVQDEIFLRQLAPHLEQVMRLVDKLREARRRETLFSSVIDRLHTGVILCDSGGRIVWRNHRAATMIEQSPHVAIVDNRVCAGTFADNQALARLVGVARSAASGERRFTLATVGKEGPEPIQLLALDTGRACLDEELSGPDMNLIALLLMKPGRPSGLSEAAVSELFGLTLAEARLAVALCDGISVGDYAEARGLSVGTVRVQLKQALAKTGAHRQAELVRHLYGSVAAQTVDSVH
ncbi:MAG TPA: hypothetical protein VNZ43_15300 [Sphingomonadaceae bacterium]|nr:hypothetical protein [Sphingomonadaceae bacterium]